MLAKLLAVFISHVLATVGNEGHQVIDGRTTSMAGMIRPTSDSLRSADSIIVGRASTSMNFNTLF
eukprot:3158484-Amphidinium_carterae.1